MLTTTVVGFFALSGGCHLQSTRGSNGVKAYHFLYDMAVQCTSGVVFPVQLCIHSPFNNRLLADDLVAYVIARSYIPLSIPCDPILLEASGLVVVLGDPNSKSTRLASPIACAHLSLDLVQLPLV
ncbi:hypothetical protein F5J12DRAFT_725014 [Pisolithus orientalis]|uniref:uncharacterized protein n=1 Tax=Pisolithus orientalis TaxID=936130 RepID=UPI00222450A1|nr:uncharacterized protein F5J12DRAFT_725014 [Pisolithus orientalis]KAI5997770.1 hypothetical protein F5J12DRAFT_725014 [Pisolithus orientalis]